VDGEQFALTGVVAWTRGGAIGLRFENVSEAHLVRLKALSDSLAR
jgi:hypothetical protein